MINREKEIFFEYLWNGNETCLGYITREKQILPFQCSVQSSLFFFFLLSLFSDHLFFSSLLLIYLFLLSVLLAFHSYNSFPPISPPR